MTRVLLDGLHGTELHATVLDVQDPAEEEHPCPFCICALLAANSR